jgi:hypothetical protein
VPAKIRPAKNLLEVEESRPSPAQYQGLIQSGQKATAYICEVVDKEGVQMESMTTEAIAKGQDAMPEMPTTSLNRGLKRPATSTFGETVKKTPLQPANALIPVTK